MTNGENSKAKLLRLLPISLAFAICLLLGLVLLPLCNFHLFGFSDRARNTISLARMQALAGLLLVYRDDFGSFPSSSPEIATRKLLRTKQPGRATEYLTPVPPPNTVFGTPRCAAALNPKTGAYSDAWGTPFFLRVSDKDGIEIRSFGPNRKDDGGGNDDLALAIPFAKDVRQPETGASPPTRPKR